MTSGYAGLILAAGASTRMGRPKALLPLGNETFVTRMAATMLQGGASPIVVVTAAALAADIGAALATAGLADHVSVVVNAHPERGQLSSLVTGLDVLRARGVAGALVCPVDVPLFSAATVTALLDAARSTSSPIVRPACGNRHGHPVVFSRQLFEEFERADLADGARTVVRAHAATIHDVPVQDEGAFADVDTPDDYKRLIGTLDE